MSEIADPTTVKLTQTTIQQLRQRYDDQDSADELISDLLDETRNSVTLTEFIDLLVDAVDPVQIALYENSDPARGVLYDFSGLVFVVNTGSTKEDLEVAVEGIDAVEVDGTPFSFAVEHDPDGPQDLGRLSLYTTVELTELNEKGIEDRVKPPVSREEGVEKVEACIRNDEVSNPL